MATPANIEEPSEPLKYSTWVLKVSIHCQGCQKKVKKVLSSIRGVHNFEVDLKLQRVVVTGHIDPDTLIYKLSKSGRNAELWPGLYNQKQNMSDQDKNNNNKPNISSPSDEGHGEKQRQKQLDNPAAAEPNDATVGAAKVVQVEVVATAKVNPADNTTAGIPTGKDEALTAGSIPMSKVSNQAPAGSIPMGKVIKAEMGIETEKSVGKKKKRKGQNGNMSGGQKEEEASSSSQSNAWRAGPQHNKNSVNPPTANNNPPRQHENQYPPTANHNPPRQHENQFPPRANNNPPRQVENQYQPRANNNPPHQVENQYPPTNYYAPPSNYVMSYNMANPTPNYTTSYYDSPTPFSSSSYYNSSWVEPPPPSPSYHNNSELPPAYVRHQQQPLDSSFELFSDENPNGCLVM